MDNPPPTVGRRSRIGKGIARAGPADARDPVRRNPRTGSLLSSARTEYNDQTIVDSVGATRVANAGGSLRADDPPTVMALTIEQQVAAISGLARYLASFTAGMGDE